METGGNLQVWLAVWVIAAGIVVFVQWKRENVGVGLVFAYLLNLWLIHWPAAFLYILPWYSYHDAGVVIAGFEQSVYGVVALGIGAMLLGPVVYQLVKHGYRMKFHDDGRQPTDDGLEIFTNSKSDMSDLRLPKLYMIIGLVSYLVLPPLIGGVPTLSALASTGESLLVVGLCLACWHAWRTEDRRAFLGWLTIATGFPFFTILLRGFIGYGVGALIVVFMFVASFFRPRRQVIAAGLLIGYFGLSLYVSYMRDRSELRAVVWGGQAVSQRVESLYSTVADLEWFDLQDQDHLQRVDLRLNQNFLVGAAVRYLSSGFQDYAAGETIWQAATAFIPRALWSGKPVFAGSPELVSTYTGFQFAPGTSVGVGQVMEFYINFGMWGVIIGFLILGGLIALFDRMAAHHLWHDDWRRFTIWYLPGLGFLQAGGSLVEVVATTGAGLATAVLVCYFVYPARQREETVVIQPNGALPVQER